MYNVHVLYKISHMAKGLVPGLFVVVSQHAGGCTAAELARENDRMARAAASREYGGLPADWAVVYCAGAWTERQTADLLAEHMRQLAAEAGVSGYVVKQSRIVEAGLVHAGDHAAFVHLDNGFRSWGFGKTAEAAEIDAAARATALMLI